MSTNDNPLDLVEDQNTAIIFDGPNFYSTCKITDINADFGKFKNHALDMCSRSRISYFTPVEEGQTALRPLLDWLDYNGYDVHDRLVTSHTNGDGQRRTRSNIEVDITLFIMRLLQNKGVDHLVLFTGNGDYTALVNEVKSHGVRVTVVSAANEACADGLRRASDQFIELTSISSIISKDE